MPKGGKIDRTKEEVEKSVMSNPKYKDYSTARKRGVIYGTLKNKHGIKMKRGGHLGRMKN